MFVDLKSNMVNLSEIRKEYKMKQLREGDIATDPVKQLNFWLEEAIAAGVNEPTAMALATVSNESRPSSRIVLLKGVVGGHLKFFTNYLSRKGKNLESIPFAAVTFFWPELERQVRVEGRVRKVAETVSEDYFNSRPLESQLGAIISHQSSVVAGREELEGLYSAAVKEYHDRLPHRPDHWGGYEIIPDYLEFWQGRPGRLHDRLVYQIDTDDHWKISRLAP